MALIIEDGTGKVDAQSYATAAQLVTYAVARAITIPATAPEQEALLLKAMDYLESLSYIGHRYTMEQALAWPRSDVFVDGWSLDYLLIPARLIRAQMQLAADAITIDLLPTITSASTGAVIEESVEGAVSVKYAEPQSQSTSPSTAGGAILSSAMALLRPLLRGYGQVRVGRG